MLRPGGKAIVYQSGIDGELTEREAARFYEPLDGFVASSDPEVVDAAIAAASRPAACCTWHLHRVMGKVDERVFLLTRPA